MDERQLRAFVAISETGRMDLAAQELGYSQSAVSYQVKCLESSLRTMLFTRDSAGMRPTDEGRMLLPSARALLLLMNQLKKSTADAHIPFVADVPSTGVSEPAVDDVPRTQHPRPVLRLVPGGRAADRSPFRSG